MPGEGQVRIPVGFAPQAAIDIDILLQRQRGIEHSLHGIEPVGLDVPLDLPRMAGGVFDDVLADLFLRASKQQVVLREIGMTQHVSRHQNVVGQTIARGNIGAARVPRKDHLEQA